MLAFASGSLAQRNVVETCWCPGVRQQPVCVEVPQGAHPSTCWYCFYFGTLTNNAAMKLGCSSLCGHVCAFLSGRFLEALLGHMVSACLSETSIFFPKWLQDLMSPPSVCENLFPFHPSWWMCTGFSLRL